LPKIVIQLFSVLPAKQENCTVRSHSRHDWVLSLVRVDFGVRKYLTPLWGSDVEHPLIGKSSLN
jgi:hypothetical protein